MKLFNDTSTQCFYCERPFNEAHYGTNKPCAKTRDHIIPVSKGGSNLPKNMVYACTECNHLKTDLSVEKFIERVQSLIDNKKRFKTIPETRLHLIIKKATLLNDYVKEKGERLYKIAKKEQPQQKGEKTAYDFPTIAGDK